MTAEKFSGCKDEDKKNLKEEYEREAKVEINKIETINNK